VTGMRSGAAGRDVLDVAVVGGGIMGITLAYFLARQGLRVEVFEASPVIGGLAGPIHLDDGTAIDRFYHAILSSDAHLNALCAEVGVADRLRFAKTRTGFYQDGVIHPMNNAGDFLRFPPLRLIDRLRLGLTVFAAQYVKDWTRLETVRLEDWLVRYGGRRVWETMWRPMLNAKFDGRYDRAPATYMWARLVRTKSTRQGVSQEEQSGYLIGGYATLLAAMARAVEAAGGRISLSTPVDEVVIERGRATGLRVKGVHRPAAAVAVTMQAPVFSRLIPHETAYRARLDRTEYLGIVCPVMVLDAPLTGIWTLNIGDDRVPFTGVIETTAYIDPADVGGHHLVYVPKYTAPGSAWQRMTDDEIRRAWLEGLQRMFPDFDPRRVRYFLVHRERYVEPLHDLAAARDIPAVTTPIDRLFLATTSQIYPALTNGESVTQHARKAADQIVRSHAARAAAPAA